ncbi:MAG: PilZ domain-containing protein [Proteobacteria bacterium]|nr:PilZ domain-containing protein [Pseudomonadota bacterium]
MEQRERDNRKISRIRLQEPLEVSLASIGSSLIYTLMTNDISSQGFFFEFESPARFPFLPSSILEIWLKIPDGEKIFLNGKMARVVHSMESQGELRKGIAISIIQISPEDKRALKNFIEKQQEKNHSMDYSEVVGAA